MSENYKLYLAGPINGCTDEECKGWRARVKKELDGLFEFNDPMERDWRGMENENHYEIVTNDLRQLHSSDIILANCFKPTAGTSSEVVYAYHYGLYVMSVSSKSPWIEYHSDETLDSLDAAIMRLKKIAEENKLYGHILYDMLNGNRRNYLSEHFERGF